MFEITETIKSLGTFDIATELHNLRNHQPMAQLELDLDDGTIDLGYTTCNTRCYSPRVLTFAMPSNIDGVSLLSALTTDSRLAGLLIEIMEKKDDADFDVVDVQCYVAHAIDALDTHMGVWGIGDWLSSGGNTDAQILVILKITAETTDEDLKIIADDLLTECPYDSHIYEDADEIVEWLKAAREVLAEDDE